LRSTALRDRSVLATSLSFLKF